MRATGFSFGSKRPFIVTIPAPDEALPKVHDIATVFKVCGSNLAVALAFGTECYGSDGATL